jgi:hypothetical protein
MDDLLSEVQDLMQDVSDVMSHVGYVRGVPETIGIVESGVAGIGLGTGVIETGSVIGKGVAGGLEIVKGSGRAAGTLVKGIKGVISEVVNTTRSEILNTISTSSGLTNRMMFKSVVLKGQTFLLSNDTYKGEEILQEYLNDFIFGPFKDSELTQTQGNRLKSSLEIWDKAFCYYQRPNNLFCRCPLSRHENVSGIIIPDHYMSLIAAKNIPGICYILLNELWCNWDKIFNIFFQIENVHPQMGNCPWDQFALNVNEYQIRAIGRCYNQTAMMRV